MPWFNVDDGFSNSKPVMRIPRRWRPPCIGVWTLCGSWSAKELTDGFVPDPVLEEYGCTPKIRQLLIEADLWESAENDGLTGISFRNWQKWQRTKQQVLDYRAAETERKRNWRSAKKQPADLPEPEDVPHMSRRDTTVRPASVPPSVPDVSALPIPKPSPTPKPSTYVTLVEGGPGGDPKTPNTARGSRLPDAWAPPQDVVAQMRSDHPHVDLKSEHAKFVDYWQGRAGKDARKADWSATWRNWIRRAAEQTPTRNGHATTGKPTQKALGWEAAGNELLAEMEQHR